MGNGKQIIALYSRSWYEYFELKVNLINTFVFNKPTSEFRLFVIFIGGILSANRNGIGIEIISFII